MRYGFSRDVIPIPVQKALPFVGLSGPMIHRVAPRRASGGVLSATGRAVASALLVIFVAAPFVLLWWIA